MECAQEFFDSSNAILEKVLNVQSNRSSILDKIASIQSLVEKKILNLGTRALVVDDDKQIRILIKKVLNDLNIDVVVASSVHEALAIIAENNIGILITDICMPYLSGLELLEKISGSAFGKIVISANVDKEGKEEIENKYNCKVFQKPFDLSLFKKVVLKELNKEETSK